jgi:hypothetical protein
MRRFVAPAGLFACLLVALAVLAPRDTASRARADETGRHPDCIEVRGEARYGSQGYDHYVFVKNGCDRRADCRVTTNVNPDPTPLRVAPGATESAVMWRGSPAREFSARADCTLEGGGNGTPREPGTR